MDHHVATDGTSFIAQSMMLFGLTALDVTIQAQVVNLMKDIQEELDMTDEIFANPIHPYTKSLLSAIPHPNPRFEKTRVALSYDKEKEGVDYTKGHLHSLSDTHQILATDEEFEKWMKDAGKI